MAFSLRNKNTYVMIVCLIVSYYFLSFIYLLLVCLFACFGG